MKKISATENYLARRPIPEEQIQWSSEQEGLIVLHKENTGFFPLIAQKLFGRPRISYIHLDEMGSFVWPLMDGKKDIACLGELVKERFGEQAEPLYVRLAKYFQILDSYSLIRWK
ncbi:MAG: PqqD family protein [Lachnospiraceae bacterium]|nr:PqqD family protein [Lachnospiraceae bacterium]